MSRTFSINFQDLEKVIHAFITSRLIDCNWIYLCLPQSSIARLQMVKNVAAWLLTRAKKTYHITPILPLFIDSLFILEYNLTFCSSFLKLLMVPRLWNHLPLHIRLAPSITTFKTMLKTHILPGMLIGLYLCFMVFDDFFYFFILFSTLASSVEINVLEKINGNTVL